MGRHGDEAAGRPLAARHGEDAARAFEAGGRGSRKSEQDQGAEGEKGPEIRGRGQAHWHDTFV
jgi:hypothetical protein